MLLNMWVPYQSVGFLGTVLVGVAFLLMASLVGNENVELLGYLAAFLSFTGSLFWVLTGIVIFINMRSILRQAEAD
jgi:hypothetical protein